MVSGLIFDVDGTLVTLKVDREKLHSRTVSELKQMGFDTSAVEGNHRYTQDMIDWARSEIDAGRVSLDFQAVRKNLNKALDELEFGWNAEAKSIPGAREVLAQLKFSSMKLATLTNSGRAPSDWILNTHRLSPYFDFTLSRDEVDAMKPRPDGMLKAISMMGLPKEELLYVGDSVIDVLAAKAAGLQVVSVVTGRYTAQRLQDEGTNYIIESLPEIFELI